MRIRYFSTILLILSFHLVMAQTSNNKAVLRHVVMFKFVDKASATETKKMEDAFRALPAKIDLIKDFEWGVNNSPEKLNQGLTHCFFLTFHSAADRDAYLIHPSHKAFTDIAGPMIDKVTVLDYWAHK